MSTWARRRYRRSKERTCGATDASTSAKREGGDDDNDCDEEEVEVEVELEVEEVEASPSPLLPRSRWKKTSDRILPCGLSNAEYSAGVVVSDSDRTSLVVRP